MANYLFLFRGGETRSLSPQQLQEHMSKWGAWIGDLSKKGQFKGGEPLGQEGRVLRGKKQTLTDGPFGETKDIVGGYLLVDAPSLNGAVELARGCPIFENDGMVEVREVREMSSGTAAAAGRGTA
jgi:hypothetical protein